MFHLFDKVYLEFDAKIYEGTNRIVISETCCALDCTGPENNFVTPIYSRPRIEDLIGEEKAFLSELDFFKELKTIGDSSSQQLVVYCDKISFIHLFIAWHKCILSNISADILWKMFVFLIEKEIYFSNFLESYCDSIFNQFNTHQWDKAVFDNKFNSIPKLQDNAWNFNIISNLGVELLLLSYIVNPDNNIKSALKSKIISLTMTSLLSEIFEAKFELILNYQNKKLQSLLNTSNIETLQELFAYPILEIFADPAIWNKSAVLYPIQGGCSLNLKAATSEQITKLIDAYNLVRVDFNGINKATPEVDVINRLHWVIAGELSDQQLDDLLNNLQFSGSSISETVNRENVNPINIMLVDWMLGLHRSSSIAKIENSRLAI